MIHEQLEREFEEQTDRIEKKCAAIDTWVEGNWNDYDYDLAPQFLAELFAGNDGAEYVDFLLKRDIESVDTLIVMYHDWKEEQLNKMAKEDLGYED